MSATISLKDHERRTLDALLRLTRTKGYPPSMRELGEAIGVRSSSTVAHRLRCLEAKGVIRRDPFAARAIQIVEDYANE